MISAKSASAIAISASLVAAANALTVNTPAALVQCQPAALSWSDGTAPYYVAIIPGGEPSASALENLPEQTGSSYTWTVDIASGTSVTVKVTDSTGTINYSDQVTIQAGTSTSCSSSSSSSSASSGSGAAAAGTSSGSSVAASSSSSSSTGSSKSSSAASVASSASSAASSAASKATSAAASAASSASSVASSAAAAATSKEASSANSVRAGLGMLVGGIVLALAA